VRTGADGTPLATVEPAVSATSLDLVGVVVTNGAVGGTRTARGPRPVLAAGR
jgi:hypothetical protein